MRFMQHDRHPREVTVRAESPLVVTLCRGIAAPARYLTNEERRITGALLNHEMHGGIFHEDGFFEHASGLYRSGPYAIMAGVKRESDAQAVRDESALYGGFLYENHWGHFLIESLARLWFLDFSAYDKVIFHAHPRAKRELSEINSFFFEALGLPLDKVEIIKSTSRFREITIPLPAIEVGGYVVHQIMADVYRRIAGYVEKIDEEYLGTPPVYYSRERLKDGRVSGEEEVAAALQGAGWRVVYPEEMMPSEQVRLAARSRVFCGVVGSALHSAIFAAPGAQTYYIHRDRHQHSTRRTLIALDGIMGLKSKHIEADIPCSGASGREFRIDPEIVLQSLADSGVFG